MLLLLLFVVHMRRSVWGAGLLLLQLVLFPGAPACAPAAASPASTWPPAAAGGMPRGGLPLYPGCPLLLLLVLCCWWTLYMITAAWSRSWGYPRHLDRMFKHR